MIIFRRSNCTITAYYFPFSTSHLEKGNLFSKIGSQPVLWFPNDNHRIAQAEYGLEIFGLKVDF